MSGSPAGSYPDAYAKVFAKDSNRPVSRGSYAEAHARKQSPSPAKRQEYYSPTVGAELAWRPHACMQSPHGWHGAQGHNRDRKHTRHACYVFIHDMHSV